MNIEFHVLVPDHNMPRENKDEILELWENGVGGNTWNNREQSMC